MKLNIKVGDIMTRNFISVKPETSIIDCAREMIKKRVGSLILEEDKRLKGLITERDIIWAIVKRPKKELSEINAKDIAVKKVTTIKPGADIEQALHKMKKGKYKWLPVLIKGNIIGILTLKDIIRIEPRILESVDEIMNIKEEENKIKKTKTGTSWIKEGICEECGNTDLLYNIDNRIICESCHDVM